MKKKLALLFCLIGLFLISCGENNIQHVEVLSAEEGDALASEFEISYEKIEYTPNVIVSQFGYDAESKKYVYFKGEELTENFYVYEQGSDLLIYEGIIEKTEDSGYYVGEFSDLKQEGTYYIQTEKIGESYPFTIKQELEYDQIYRILLENFSAQDPNKYTDREKLGELFPVLVAHEMYPTAFFDGDLSEVPNGIPDILDYLIEVADILLQNQSQGTMHAKDLFLDAAFFAKLSNAMEGYDKELATQFKNTATECYINAESEMKDELGQEDCYIEAYFAATELYRIKGGYSYKIDCIAYANEIPNNDKEINYIFYADMTLMSTRRSVDVAFCNSRMEELRTHIVAWNEEFGKYPFFYSADNMQGLLNHGLEVLWILSLDYNEEYANFSSEILDYVTGLNLEGVSYVPEIGYTISKETVSENLEWNNQYLIMICRYMQQEEQE